MKPSDLKAPFKWNDRCVTIHDRIFYVPTRCDDYEKFTFPGWADPLFFGNENPIHIEYCSGNGSWIAEKAADNPALNWVAVEKKFLRARKIWSKCKNLGLQNLLVICGEASLATRLYLPSNCIEGAYINFPDPWPKKRHAKHRLIRPDFVQQIWRILKPDAPFTLVTDDPDYSERMISEMGSHRGFNSTYPFPHYATEFPNYGSSFFEQLWREQGKTIRFHQYRKGEA